jgi:hypothetical protein
MQNPLDGRSPVFHGAPGTPSIIVGYEEKPTIACRPIRIAAECGTIEKTEEIVEKSSFESFYFNHVRFDPYL